MTMNRNREIWVRSVAFWRECEEYLARKFLRAEKIMECIQPRRKISCKVSAQMQLLQATDVCVI